MFNIKQINPPLVLGPVVNYLASLDSINTSNSNIAAIISGQRKDKLQPASPTLWVDVRDLALAHVLAMEKPEAAGERFFIVAGHHSSKQIAELLLENFPEYRDKLPTGEGLEAGALPPDGYRFEFDNTRSKEILGLQYRPFKETLVDAVTSMKALEE